MSTAPSGRDRGLERRARRIARANQSIAVRGGMDRAPPSGRCIRRRQAHDPRGVLEADRVGGRLMAFIPHTEADVREMLAAIGAESIEALFDEIPASVRAGPLTGVPEALGEMEIGRLMRERAAADGQPLCFLGAGAYEHHI